MPEFSDLSLEILSWLIPAMVLVFFFLMPVAVVLVYVIESFKARRGIR